MERHLPKEEFEVLKEAEKSERELLSALARREAAE
jgi:hypothetical protein